MTVDATNAESDSVEHLEAFRRVVREFIATALPDDVRDRTVRGYAFVSKEDCVFWQRRLVGQGWGAPSWPKEYGGAGWSAAQRRIFEDECARACCPRTWPQGLKMIGPIICAFGTDWQKQRFLPPLLSGDEWWCQGYSEPNAGSDLASLRTSATREGEFYRVNGQKVWTTLAHWADFMFCLVRTRRSEKPQDGITFLLIDMRSPGVRVRPILTLEGHHHTNEVFLDDVLVPVRNRIGEEDRGWRYAKALLVHERAGVAELGRTKERLSRLTRLVSTGAAQDRATYLYPETELKIAELQVQMLAAEAITDRLVLQETADWAVLSSILKLRGTELAQEVGELTMDALGSDAIRLDIDLALTNSRHDDPLPSYATGRVPEYLTHRAATIAGGSNEIQRNVIAKMLFKD